MESILLAHTGLSAKEVFASRKKNGTNQIDSRKKNFIIQIVRRQLESAFVYLLFVGAIISFLIGEKHDGFIILAVVVINFLIGFYQEYKSEVTLQALQKLTKTQSRVLRDNQILLINSRDLVIGDLLLLQEGERVGADVKLLNSSHLEIDESTINGENLPIFKDEKSNVIQLNTCYAGTTVIAGEGLGQVVAIGSKTILGQINISLSLTPATPTPLQQKLHVLTKQISQVAGIIAALVFFALLLQGGDLSKNGIFVISLLVAVVPEGLPGVISITLAIAIGRLAKKNAIVRNISAVEGLANVTLIATDKTGTLTLNQMHAKGLVIDAQMISPTNAWSEGHFATVQPLIEAFMLASTKRYVTDEHGKIVLNGNSTENAINEFLQYFESKMLYLRTVKKLDTLPYDQKTKRTTTQVLISGQKVSLYQGAPEFLLEEADHFYNGKSIVKLSKLQREVLLRAIASFAKKGYRMVGVSSHSKEKHIYFGALVIEDPVRKEVKEEVVNAQKAGICVVMITGDNEHTSSRVATEVGILGKGDRVITGREIDMFSDTELKRILKEIKVFARVTPTQKHRIVTLFQGLGEVVAVTGDGVNDAIALKGADIGIAMGRGGSEVAKETADIILTDDNFTTIYQAILEAKKVVLKIQKSVEYIFCTNIIEMLVVIVGFILYKSLIFNPIQLLYINLITDTIPSLAFGFSHRLIVPKHQVSELLSLSRFYYLVKIAFMFILVFFSLRNLADSIGVVLDVSTFAFLSVIFAQIVVFLWEYFSAQRVTQISHIFADIGFLSSMFVFLGLLAIVYSSLSLRELLHLEPVTFGMGVFVLMSTLSFQLGFFYLNRTYAKNHKSLTY